MLRFMSIANHCQILYNYINCIDMGIKETFIAGKRIITEI